MFHFTTRAAFMRYLELFHAAFPGDAPIVCLKCGHKGRGRISFSGGDGDAYHDDNDCLGLIRPYDLDLALQAVTETKI